LLLLWPLAAFGGRGAATAVPFSVSCILFALTLRPAVASRGPARALDLAALAAAVVTVLQALPLPRGVVDLLSPHAALVRLSLALEPSSPAWLPFSIDGRATLWASAVTAGAIALFFAARTVLARGGVRQTVRGISALGFLFSVVAIAQAATAGRLIYWRFPTEYEGPLPFGPFVNRNHFATWVIMAAPLCLGYIVARANKSETKSAGINPRARLARLADGRTLWLTAAGAMMIGALLLSLSRSGILSLAGAGATSMLVLRRQASAGRGWWLVGILAVTVGLGLSRADLPALTDRFVRSGSSVENRLRIWRDTAPVVQDFWLTGTGAGTYRTAMLYYQRSDRVVQFNQAHNHYLQATAEGGIVLLAIVAGALGALAGAVRERLASEGSGVYWIRAGAVCGLIAVALQSLWETGLVMPANAALAAVLAAIALHERLPAEKSIFKSDGAETGNRH
jgi:putative inorganic carbon (HCO3(-)) transporter